MAIRGINVTEQNNAQTATSVERAAEKEELMINYNCTGERRKKLVQALTKITGEPSVYLGMPTCGFRVGDYTVSKTGEVSPHPSEEIIAALAAAGFRGEEQTGGPVISIPRKGMTENAITCLKNMLNSKRPLIRKALGLQSTLPIEVTEDAIIARWYELEDAENFDVAKKLMEAMVKQAKRAKRVDPTPVRSDNPKYSFRVFLNALEFTGDEYKGLRKELLKNLEGSSAWRHGKPEVDA